MANHYVATWPTSPFARRLIVMRADETERRSLLDRTLAVRRGKDEEERRELSPDEALAVVRADFGVELDDGESTMLRRHLARDDGPGAAPGATTEEPARVH